MITPRVTRLVRVPDYKAMRAVVAQLALGVDVSVRRTAVLVPTRSAAEELRRSFESSLTEGSAAMLPHLLTRSDFYRHLHAGTPSAPPLLSETEREVLLRRAAREAADAGAVPPFRLRPGLIVQMLDFYDELRRREQTLDDFERLVTGYLAPSVDMDRGAERLMRQTEFLCAAFAGFERAISATGGIDEHGLRAILLGGSIAQRAFEHVIVTVADQAADPRGLYASDFDLLTRLPGLKRIDVVASEAMLAAGFHERIHQLLPELLEVRMGEPGALPVVAAPEAADASAPWFTFRDREEELAGVVRWLHDRCASSHHPAADGGDEPPPLDGIALVFQRPLPYLYLSRQVFGDARLPFQASDALPLSAEPLAATIDVIFAFIETEANRHSIRELLAAPHLSFSERVDRRSVAALDEHLKELEYSGGWERLEAIAIDAPRPKGPDPRVPLECARVAAAALRPVATAETASAQIAALIEFLNTYDRAVPGDDDTSARHLRARAAILALLDGLRQAHQRHDDRRIDIVELSGTVRRWIEAQTFSPRTGVEGVRLLDAASAPYAEVDELRLLGLVERDWPEPSRRSIFYPASILSSLGWPADASRMTAERARFQDLLGSAAVRVSASTFTLEDDAIVSGSPLLEELATAGLQLERWPATPAATVFVHEVIESGAAAPDPTTADWLALRRDRPTADGRFSGFTGPGGPRTYAISYLERYLDCPFKYFAGQVLKLPEERDEEAGLSPIERGHFVHEVFETFFTEWQAAGHRTITTANAADALEMFEAVAMRKLARLPEADRALERNYLLGSAAASGLAERAFAFEIEQGGEVVERLLEKVLEGAYTFTGDDGPRTVRIKAKADRIDLMADGTLRIIDYKIGRAPKQSRSLQLPIYGVMAQQELEGHRGRSWTVAAAGYVAFKEKEPFVPLGGRATALEAAIADGQKRMLAAVDAIERGEFPVQPDEPFRCQWCGYAGVCRKDYVGDE